MIKLSAITEMFKHYGETCYKTNDLITELDDSEDIFFKTIEDGMPVAFVQYLGRWSSPKMMQRYISITPENLREIKRFGY